MYPREVPVSSYKLSNWYIIIYIIINLSTHKLQSQLSRQADMVVLPYKQIIKHWNIEKQENHVYTCMSAYDKYVTEKNLEIEMRRFFTMVDIPYIY